MEIRTALLIILAVIAALTIVFYQYFYKNPKKGNLKIILAALRFVTLFCILLLLINPKFIKNMYSLEKSNLVVLVDGSASMELSAQGGEIRSLASALAENEQLQERFNILRYAFGKNLYETDTVNFTADNTDIANALSRIDEVVVNQNSSVLLLTDGNQTLGRDYEYTDFQNGLQVNPIVIGDTTTYDDISISRVTTNTYAFLKNKFPVEATIEYNGNHGVAKILTLDMDGKRVFQQKIALGPNESSTTISTLLEAESAGLKSLVFQVQFLDNERNRTNNTKEVAVEVIDEKTNVAIVSAMLHPDIGTLKKSMESNERRKVSIKMPTEDQSTWKDIDLFVLYQPNSEFKTLYEYMERNGSNLFTITGTQTDWGFLNQVQQSFFKENYNQSEEIFANLNNAFSIFGLESFNTAGFPPLESNLGDLELGTEHEDIFTQRIRGVDLERPLLSIISRSDRKEAVLFGENIWRWRAKSYQDLKSFKEFDNFMGRLLIYLTSTGKKNRLELDYKSIFEGAGSANIRALYYDESYSFDPNGNISINIKGIENGFSREMPMLLKDSFYESDLGDLAAGTYDFTVSVAKENLTKKGRFKILDFTPEDQQLPSNHQKLKRLSDKTKGKLYFPDNVENMVDDLMSAERFIPIQRSDQNVVSLIDFKIFLGLPVLCLALEWLIRKYNGLI